MTTDECYGGDERMTGTSGTRGGFIWTEDGNFAALTRSGDEWEISYGFEATAKQGRRVVAQQATSDYEDAIRQLCQVIGYYFAEPEHAERVRRDLLARADLDAGQSRYLPVPDAAFLTGAGGGVSGQEQAVAEVERRERILRGEDEAPAPSVPAAADKRPWWRRFGRKA